MKISLLAILIVFRSLGGPDGEAFADNPVPFINQPLAPGAAVPGGPEFVLTANGTGFVSGSVVEWNGSPLVTQLVSGSQLKATVPAADIAAANTAAVTVVNPPPGGGASNAAIFTVTKPTSSVAFTLAPSPAAGYFPSSAAVGDFNGDGKLDLAVANYLDNTVSILLGDGAGHFALASSPATGIHPRSVAAGDFNGDGKLDLATANDSGTVSILLGDGAGHFTSASSPALGNYPDSLALGDFNADGKLELAVATLFGNTVSVLLRRGAGNFALGCSMVTGAYPTSVAVGDFNGDGKLDLAVANRAEGTVSILLGNGDATFSAAVNYSLGLNGPEPSSVAVADVNGDGKLDLVLATRHGISVLFGNGDGSFQPAVASAVPFAGSRGYASSLALGDFNGDGRLDLAVANSGSSTVHVLLGDGKGNFIPASSPVVDGVPQSVAVGDFNGDGRLDLAVASSGTNAVSILLQVPAHGDAAPGRAHTLSSAKTKPGAVPFHESSE